MNNDCLDKIFKPFHIRGGGIKCGNAKQQAKAKVQRLVLEGKVEELENIKGRRFTEDEMMGMDIIDAQSARAINAFVGDIEKRINKLQSQLAELEKGK